MPTPPDSQPGNELVDQLPTISIASADVEAQASFATGSGTSLDSAAGSADTYAKKSYKDWPNDFAAVRERFKEEELYRTGVREEEGVIHSEGIPTKYKDHGDLGGV